MNQSKFSILIAAAAVVSVAAWWAGSREQARYEVAESGPLFPQLESQLGQVDKVTVLPAGGEAFTLSLSDDRWGLEERGGYTVDTGVLRRELRKLATVKRVEAKTANPAYYERLGVQPVDQADGTTIRLALEAGGKTVADVLIGKSGTGGSYLRAADAEQSWLGDQRLAPPRAPAEWLDRTVIEVPRDRLAQIRVTPAAGEPYTLSRSAEGQRDFVLDPLPEGRELEFANVNRLGAALARLRFNDVSKTSEVETASWSRTEFASFDGLVVTVHSRKLDDGGQVRLEASYREPSAEAETKKDAESDPDAAGKADDAEDPAEIAARVQAEVEEINARVRGWTYDIATYAVTALAFDIEALLKDEPDTE